MKHNDPLLQAVVANPDDDAPRLMYADYLDEHGDPDRAEFIRLQCELARIPEEDPRRERLQEREEALLAAHREQWLGPLSGLLSDPRFRRGFVEQGSMGTRKFLTNADKVFRLTPLQHLKLMRLAQTRDGAKDVAACPLLSRLRGLDLKNSGVGDDNLTELLASPHLGGLTTLQLAGTQAGPRTLAVLRDSPPEGLTHLDLSHNWLGGNLSALTGAEPRFRLDTLDLEDNDLTAEAVESLTAWPGLASLRELSVANNNLRVAGGERLAASPHLARLTRLDIRSCNVGLTGMRALAASEHLRGLTTLVASGNSIGPNGVRALTESPHWTGLTVLELATNHLGDRGVEALAAWPGLARLRALRLGNNQISDQGLAALAQSPYLGGLRELGLEYNEFGDAGLRALAACPGLAGLESLQLAANFGIRDAGVKALLESPHLAELKRLQVDGMLLSPAFRDALQARFGSFVLA